MSSSTTITPRERWRAFFLEILAGQDELAELATDAAIRALRAGATQEDAVEAGMRASRRAADPATPARSGPAPHRSASAPAAPPRRAAGPTDATYGGWPAGSGVAVFVDRRTESFDGQFFQVLSCRLRELAGGRLVGPIIPVEMRARSIIGHLVKDDVVQIPDGRPGETRIVKTMQNLTTGSQIEAKGRPFRRWRTLRRTLRLALAITGGLVVLAFLAAILWVGVMLLNSSGSTFG
jgi:hypothetical protein